LLYAPNTGGDFFKILAVSLVLSLLLLPMTELSGVEIMKEVEIFAFGKDAILCFIEVASCSLIAAPFEKMHFG
jgi:hypothetical protein